MPVRVRAEWKGQVGPGEDRVSLCKYLASHCLIDEDQARDLVEFGSVHVQGRQELDPERKLCGGDQVRVFWPWNGTKRHYEIDPTRILYRDAHLLAYNKEAGIPSQQTPSDGYNNLFAALKRYLLGDDGKAYAALHQRLDRDTSGVILFAIDRSVNRGLSEAFRLHQVKKFYLAWVEGLLPTSQGEIDQDISRGRGRYQVVGRGKGKRALTRYEVLKELEDKSLVRAQPLTGRTHQIRLHFAAQGCPIVGDRLYGHDPDGPLMLHAYRLVLSHPVTKARLDLTAPLPDHWLRYPLPPAIPG